MAGLTRNQYFALAGDISREAGLPDTHAYFEQHKDRLWLTISAFDLFSKPHLRILEIGPYYSYTPFVWKQQMSVEVSVYEGASPEAYALEPLYQRRGIQVCYGDFFDVFGHAGSNRLPYENDVFDLIICWETMEHFNFNPVPFIGELRRVLKQGGVACITVPNLAKMDKRMKLLCGGSPLTPVKHYLDYANERYYGFHWREYTLGEITELFRQNSFQIELSRHLQAFQNRDLKFFGKMKRLCASALTAIVPGCGALCLVRARK